MEFDKAILLLMVLCCNTLILKASIESDLEEEFIQSVVEEFKFPETFTKATLPDLISLKSYDVKLLLNYGGNKTDAPESNYTGTVDIKIKVGKRPDGMDETRKSFPLPFLMNTGNLSIIGEIKMRSSKPNSENPILKTEVYPQGLGLVYNFRFDTTYTIKIEFSGEMHIGIEDNWKGFGIFNYLEKDESEKMQLRKIVLTNFVEDNAGYAFPCFANPEYPAKFKITFQHQNTVRVTNTKVRQPASENLQGLGYIESVFKSPSALRIDQLSFIIGTFFSIDKNMSSEPIVNASTGIPHPPLRIWFRHRINVDRFELFRRNVDLLYERILKFTGYYLGTTLDVVLIPNLPVPSLRYRGLLCLREENILETDTSIETIEGSLLFVTEEMTHQWLDYNFQPSSSLYSWFNDILARFVAVNTVAKLFPGSHTDEVVYGKLLFKELENDTLPTATTMDKMNDPSSLTSFQIQSLRNKGSITLLWMYLINHKDIYLYEETVREALNGYLQYVVKLKHESDPDIKMFFSSLSKAAKENLSLDIPANDIFQSWFFNLGHPVIMMDRNQNGFITASQKPYPMKQTVPAIGSTSEAEDRTNQNDNITWTLEVFPSKISFDGCTELSPFWLNSAPVENFVQLPDSGIFVNNMNSFSLVDFDAITWELLKTLIETKDFAIFIKKVSVLGRARLAYTVLTFAWDNYGYVGYRHVLSILQLLKQEDQYLPMYISSLGFIRLRRMVRDDFELLQKLEGYFTSLLLPYYETITDITTEGWYLPNYSSENRFRRMRLDPLVYQLATAFNVKGSRIRCYKQFNDWYNSASDDIKYLDKMNPISDAFRYSTYSGYVFIASNPENEEYFDKDYKKKLLNIFRMTSSDKEKLNVLLALGCSQHGSIAENLEFLNSKEVTESLVGDLYDTIVEHEELYSLATDFYFHQYTYTELAKKNPNILRHIDTFMRVFVIDEEKVEQVTPFLEGLSETLRGDQNFLEEVTNKIEVSGPAYVKDNTRWQAENKETLNRAIDAYVTTE